MVLRWSFIIKDPCLQRKETAAFSPLSECKISASFFVCVCAFLHLLCDVKVAGVDAVSEQILCAAALTGPEHTVVGLEQLTAEDTLEDTF